MRFFLFLLNCLINGLNGATVQTPAGQLRAVNSTPGDTVSPDPPLDKLQRPIAEPMEQKNVSQLLQDYDNKVRTVSSGSDCICRCTFRPISLSQCSQKIQNESFTVTTETSGTDCGKCECVAPLSAVNPCEAENRFKRLMEASKDDIRMAAILDLLKGKLNGTDLLKLHSITTSLLSRVENMEKALSRNSTSKDRAKEKAKEKERKNQEKKKKTNDSKAGENEGQRRVPTIQKQVQSVDKEEKQQATTNKTEVIKLDTKETIKDKSSKVIRGWTFYKAEEENFQQEKRKGKHGPSVDLLASDEQIFHPQLSSAVPYKTDKQQTTVASTADTKEPVPAKTTAQSHVQQTTKQLIKVTQVTEHTTPPTTIQVSTAYTSPPMNAVVANPPQAEPRSRLGWTESADQRPQPTTKPAMCKDTVASISEPVLHNSYGQREGAWMKDARGHGNVIYLTNGHYGSDLLEYRDITFFKAGQVSNTYKLPYSYTGTGHVVFNGALYYNRAFSRDVIRYDLRQRYVTAWTTLHDAILEEESHRVQTEVEFAVDESGIWLLYPAVDTEGFKQEVILLNHLRHRDLQTIRSFRTGLRRGHNSFLVCGVLYGVDSMDRHHANVTYAFDTHTLTHTVPNLAFINTHSYTSQLAYCPLDKKLYAWDNGHQMTYDIVFAY